MQGERRRYNDIGTEEEILAAIDATIRPFYDGDIVEGVIVKVDRDEVLLDIGYKTYGVIPWTEMSMQGDVDPGEIVKVGDEAEALVLQKEDQEGRLILSRKRAQYERAWGTIEKIKEEDGVVTGTVIEVVKDGLILDIGLPGFLPASLVEMQRVRNLKPYVGKKIEAKIIELDKNRNSVVLSRRALLEQRDAGTASALKALRKQLADQTLELDEMRKQHAANKTELDELRAAADRYVREAKKLDELQAAAERYIQEGKDARAIARSLWAAMPPQGRLDYFESSSSWLPEWIVATG